VDTSGLGVFSRALDEGADFRARRREFIEFRLSEPGKVKMRNTGELAETVTLDTFTGECLSQFAAMFEVELPDTCDDGPS
jgi:hypothetical protein